MGWFFLQGPLHPEAGHLPRPAELWRSPGQLKVWEHLCFPGGQSRAPSPILPAQAWKTLRGGGGGDRGCWESSYLRTTKMSQRGVMMVSACGSASQSTQRMRIQHFACLLGYFEMSKPLEQGSRTIVQAWGGEPAPLGLAVGVMKFGKNHFTEIGAVRSKNLSSLKTELVGCAVQLL